MTVTLLDPPAALDAGEPVVGDKAHGLARLIALGCTVPDFVVVPVDAFRAHLRRVGVLDALELGLDAAHRPGTGPPLTDRSVTDPGELAGAVLAEPLAPDLTDALAAHLALLGDGPWAVRSSVVGGDPAFRRFAGQLDSYLFQPDLRAVLTAVRRCWASPLAPRVAGHAARNGLDLAALRMAVVVQRMVDAQVSAVAFTANPLNGERDETLINAAWGQGVGIVSGRCNTDEHLWVPGLGEVGATVADKDVRVVAAPGGEGTVEEPVPADLRRLRALAEDQVAEIGELGRYLQARLGGPQDLELCYAGGVLHVLQARPVACLPEPVNQDGPTGRWDNATIPEGWCGPTTPLTFSLAETFLQGRRLGLLGGRIYEAAEPIDPGHARRLSRPATAGRHVADFQAHVGTVTGEIDRTTFPDLTYSQLMDVIGLLDRGLGRSGDVLVLNDRQVQRTRRALRRTVAAALATDADDPEVVRLADDLVAGIDGIESVEPTHVLLTMAATARRDPALTAALRVGDTAEALYLIRRLHPTFAARIDEYLDRYGDRVMGELKLESRSLRENPGFVLDILRTYVDRPDLDPGTPAARRHQVHDRAVREVASKLTGGRARRSFERRVDACRRAVKDHESLRLDRTRLVGLYRDVYRAVGRRLHDVGRLDQPDDIVWLTADEVLAHHEGRSVTRDLAALARLRRRDFEGFATEEIPDRFETTGPVGHGNRYTTSRSGGADRAATTLHGTGCRPGVVEGPVRVVHSPDDDLSLNGCILVAARTDPGWAPLFPTCSGLLVERGSTRSHAAVVARELGIPTVVGIPGLTRILRDGERVRLDGTTGTVERGFGTGPDTPERSAIARRHVPGELDERGARRVGDRGVGHHLDGA